MSNKKRVALAGQPNAGKSTLFNMLTGARQHVANYPGVTVEKKYGYFSARGVAFELVDLPGTYSLTAWSLEERVTRDFLLRSDCAAVVDVVDASNLKRHLHLTIQLLEMELPVVLVLNMMDVAAARKQHIELERLAASLNVPVVPAVGRRGQGKEELKAAILDIEGRPRAALRVEYGQLEMALARLQRALETLSNPLPARWLAVKLLEGDPVVLDEVPETIRTLSRELADEFFAATGETAVRHIERCRHDCARRLAEECVHAPEEGRLTPSDKIDRIICHRIWGYPILLGIMYLMYYLSIELGYKATAFTWPVLAWGRDTFAALLPAEGFLFDPMLRMLLLWLVDSINALLNYVPIFFILFAYIAFLEDLGYMPRMAFLLDAFFRRFGLHGQSTLPLVLGGVYVGGCAVPAVMASRAVPDERARLATILVAPMMNCLAKAPLYVLLISAYFPACRSQAMFFISTITVLMALTTAKCLNLSLLRKRESAPFIMEMPPWHLPTVGAVLRSGLERVWMYVRKIATVVAAVAVTLFVLMQFPGLSSEGRAVLTARASDARTQFLASTADTRFALALEKPEAVEQLVNYESRYRSARSGVSDEEQAAALDALFRQENPAFFAIVRPGADAEGKRAARAFRTLRQERLQLRAQVREETVNRSILGVLGKWLEPVTRFAGFTWRVNVALLAALAAKENTVATLGALYGNEGADAQAASNQQEASGVEAKPAAQRLETRMSAQEIGFTPLHALALMLFLALYPPCMAAAMMIKVQSGSWSFMLFSLAYMTGLGALVATLVYSGGSALGLTGPEAMAWFYGLAATATLVAGLVKPQPAES